MKSDFTARWAESPATLRREPTPTELAGGYPCGDLDLQLFNEMAYRLTQAYGELAYVISASGQVANSNNLTQVWQAIQIAAQSNSIPAPALLHSGTDTSTTANQITIQSVSPDVGGLADFQVYEVVPANSNTGPVTLTIKNFPAASLLRRDGIALSGGDLVAGSPYLVVRLGSAFRLLSFARSEVISFVSTSNAVVPSGAINPLTNSGAYTFTPTSGGSFSRTLTFTAPSNGVVKADGIFFTANTPSPTDVNGNGPSMTVVVGGSISGSATQGGSTTYTIAVPTTKSVVKGENVTVTVNLAFPGTTGTFPASQAGLSYIFVPSA